MLESLEMAKILVVEDDESMNEILVSTLEEEDHNVRSAFNGPKAIEIEFILAQVGEIKRQRR